MEFRMALSSLSDNKLHRYTMEHDKNVWYKLTTSIFFISSGGIKWIGTIYSSPYYFEKKYS